MNQGKTKGEEVSTDDALATFHFDLLVSSVPIGVIEGVISELEDDGPTKTVFENPDLGRYFINLSKRLRALDSKT